MSNQLIPLTLNYDTDMSDGNGVSVSESGVLGVLGVLGVSGVLGVDRKERIFWLQKRRKKRHKSPFLRCKKIGKNPSAGFSISIFPTPNQNNPTPYRTYTFQVMGNTPAAAVI